MNEKTLERALCDALGPYVPPDKDILDAAEAVIAALGIPAATLRGLREKRLVAVPVEPTHAMRRAFHLANAEYENGEAYPDSSPDYQWACMLAAAQEPQHDR